MKDDEELELAALERKLEDAFATTRPRAGFEDELWLHMQAKRPVGRRLQDMLSGLFDSVREAPRIPAAAVATFLIVAFFGSIWFSGHWPAGGGSTASLTTGRNSEDGAGGSSQYAYSPFGHLPAPGLEPPTVQPVAGGPKVSGPEDLSGATAYYGPVNVTWSGKLSSSLASAQVYRYAEPPASVAASFAQKVGAAPHGTPPPSFLGTYSSRDFTLVVRGTVRSPSSEPAYLLTPTAPGASSASNDAVQVAKAFLQAHNLTPDWPYVTATEKSGSVTHVLFLKQFSVPGQGNADAVDGAGAQYGVQVDVQDSRVLTVSGPLPLELDSALYPLISSEQAVQMALNTNPAGAQDTATVPSVTLTNARLVYTLAVGADHSYFEPGFLFSGTFTMNGQTYVKRILVPAVTPSLLSS